MRSYEVARKYLSFLEFGAWSIVVIGVIIAVIGAGGGSRYGGVGAGLFAMGPGIGIGIAGFLLVAFVQMGRATVDTAEYTQQMLKISRDQLEVSKQSLKRQSVVPQTFAATAQTESAQEPKNSFAVSSASSVEKPEPLKSAESPRMKITQAKGQEEIVEYKGQKISVQGDRYVVGEKIFFVIDRAKLHIDKMENISASLEPKQNT